MTVSLSAAERRRRARRHALHARRHRPHAGLAPVHGPFTLTNATTVKFRTWDLGGNAELVRTQAIKLDADAPTAAITLAGGRLERAG